MNNQNDLLKEIETYLQDLSVMDRAKILGEINEDISDKNLDELNHPLVIANQKRTEHGLAPYREQKQFSYLNFFLKFTAVMTILGIGTVSFFVWKFTPVFKVDEEQNRVIILGGLIDIDGKAGKVKFFDQYHFVEDKFTNELQATLEMDSTKDEVLIDFNSGSFTLSNSDSEEVTLDCKLAKPADDKLISQAEDYVKLNFKAMEGSNCRLGIPRDKKVTLEGNDGYIHLIQPEYNAYIELGNGIIAIEPELEQEYKFDLTVDNGYIGEFPTSESEEAFEIQASLKNGSITRK